MLLVLMVSSWGTDGSDADVAHSGGLITGPGDKKRFPTVQERVDGTRAPD